LNVNADQVVTSKMVHGVDSIESDEQSRNGLGGTQVVLLKQVVPSILADGGIHPGR